MKTTRPIFPTPVVPFTTERLLFRALRESDLEDFHAIRTDIELMKWTSSAKCDENIEATRVWMSRFLPPNDKETLSYAIEELSNPGKIIGSVGVHQYDPPEFGYCITQKHWGKGYATEAAKAVLAVYWAFERKSVDVDEEDQERERLRAITDFDNVASRKVLHKCGFIFAGEGEFEGRRDARYYLEAPFT